MPNLPVPDGFSIPRERKGLGSARYIGEDELNRQGYVTGDFWLGRTSRGRPIGWSEDLNLLTCAGPRSGKGVATVIPNLLEFPGSVVVVDPKGELANKTARYRRDVLGQKVIVLDPVGLAKDVADLRGTYNPFDDLEPDDPYVVTAAQTMAEGIVVPNPNADDKFWESNALDLIQACILYMLKNYPTEERTLPKLRQTIALGDKELFKEYVRLKQANDPNFRPDMSKSFELFLEEMFEMEEDFGGVCSETAGSLSGLAPETRTGIKANARTNMLFLNAAELHEVLQSNIDPSKTFRLSELRRQDRPLTVYLCLPVDMMPIQGRWFRMIILRMIQYIQRSEHMFDKKLHQPILMMIDEFYQLGPIHSIVNTLTFAASSGLRLWLIVQDLEQIKQNYPNSWGTILGSCGIKQFFGVNDLVTAKYISEILGEEEIDVPSISLTETYSDADSVNESDTIGEGETDTIGTSESRGLTRTESESFSEGTTETTGTNRSATIGTNASQAISKGQSTNQNASSGTSTTNSVNVGSSTSTGHSENFKDWRFFFIQGTTHMGSSQSSGAGRNHSTGQSVGVTNSTSSGTGASTSATNTHGTSGSETVGSSQSTAQSRTHGRSTSMADSQTTGTSTSQGTSRNRSKTTGTGTTSSRGKNYAWSFAKQKRSLLQPSEVMLAFTKDNLMQLLHIRDQGGMMLMRTPYYADPYFRSLISDEE